MDSIYSTVIEDDRVGDEFGGGIPKSSLVYIEGDDGSGKSVLTQRFLYGFCKNSYTVSYITPEFDFHGFTEQMDSLSYDILDYIITDDMVQFTPANVNTSKKLLAQQDSQRPLLSRLASEQASYIWESDIIIIDSLDLILRNDPRFEELHKNGNGDVAIQNFVSFLSKFVDQGKSIIITLNENNVDDHILSPLKSQSDIYFALSVSESMGGRVNDVDVIRYSRSTANIDGTISFQIQSGNGLSIDKRSFA